MKHFKSFLFLLLFVNTNAIFAQNDLLTGEKPYIEIEGTADLEVIPDEIYISLVIRERYENKDKITIESQEEQLTTYLKSIGIDMKNLYLSDANSDYVKVKWREKDVLTQKDYTLKVANANTVKKVFQHLDKLKINDAYISKVNHSKLDSIKKEVKIMAIKSAKNKAEYLLLAIGEQIGKPQIVRERENNFMPVMYNAAPRRKSFQLEADAVSQDKEEDEIQFNKIKVEAFVYVKFLIK